MLPDGRQLGRISKTPGSRSRNTQLTSQLVGQSLVPGPADGLPIRSWHTEEPFELIAPPRERGDYLVAGRIQDPALEPEPLSDGQRVLEDFLLGEEPRHAHGMRGISGVAGNRRLVIDNAHRYPAATQ